MSTPETGDFAPSISSQMAAQQRAFNHATTMQVVLMAIGAVNAALFLVGVFVAGLLTNNSAAWKLSLETLAVCYVAAFVQVTFPPPARGASFLSMALVASSIVLGTVAGFSLLGGI